MTAVLALAKSQRPAGSIRSRNIHASNRQNANDGHLRMSVHL